MIYNSIILYTNSNLGVNSYGCIQCNRNNIGTSNMFDLKWPVKYWYNLSFSLKTYLFCKIKSI